MSGMGQKGGGPFMKLVSYMTRESDHEASESVLWHGFYGYQGMPNADIVREFQENARLLKERKNGNVLYHEILSFSAGHTLQGEALSRVVSDIGQEYLRHRAPDQMAFGAIHWDTEHAHLHLMISANARGKSKRLWLTKEKFSDIQKSVESFVLTRYPELAQTPIYDREQSRERLKTQTHEQSMKSRTGESSRKETTKSKLHSLFERAGSMDELHRLLRAEGIEMYVRGKSVGVIVRESDGQERRHRLSTLGLADHYEATAKRFQSPKAHEADRHARAPDFPGEANEALIRDTGATDGRGRDPIDSSGTKADVRADMSQEKEASRPTYTDDVLERARGREHSETKNKPDTPER